MIVKCSECKKFYDDEFRLTICPHNTFSANDGWNNFRHYPESWLANYKPRVTIIATDNIDELEKKLHINLSEHDNYQRWLNKNRVRTEEKP